MLVRKFPITLAVLLTWLTCVIPHSTYGQSIPNIDAISAHLFYERSGSFSDNIASPAQFHGWNTIIGEGDAREPANDILIKIYLSAGENKQTFTKVPLIVDVKDRKTGKKIVRRSFQNLLFGYDGKLVKASWLPDVTCAELQIEASVGASRRIVTADFKCGE
jgi:hypothetical protein